MRETEWPLIASATGGSAVHGLQLAAAYAVVLRSGGAEGGEGGREGAVPTATSRAYSRPFHGTALVSSV